MCNKETKTCCENKEICKNSSNDYLIVVVLYILLVIILATCLF